MSPHRAPDISDRRLSARSALTAARLLVVLVATVAALGVGHVSPASAAPAPVTQAADPERRLTRPSVNVPDFAGPSGNGSRDTGVRTPVVPAQSSRRPIAPVVRPTPGAPSQPGMQIDLGGNGEGPLNSPISLVLLLGAISLVPALLIMATAFTRIVIVLGFVRSALGTNGIPPNQVIIGLALFLSLFVMAPTLTEANEKAVGPFSRGEISQSEALRRGVEPFRAFMLKQVRKEDIALFVKLSGAERPANEREVATTTLAPAFILSELRTAFLIGFVIFVPFIIIDLIVSAALSAIGMVMLPPVLISLPFKLLLFVAADGWSLVVQSLIGSFRL